MKARTTVRIEVTTLQRLDKWLSDHKYDPGPRVTKEGTIEYAIDFWLRCGAPTGEAVSRYLSTPSKRPADDEFVDCNRT